MRRHHCHFALAISLISGCGRIGYEPLARVVGGDARAPADAAWDLPGAEAAPETAVPVDTADVPSVDAPVADAPPVSDAPVDASPPSPDVAPAAAPTGTGGTATCFDYPTRRDLIADFEDGTPTTIVIDGRGGGAFRLVQSGAGDLSVVTAAIAQSACGSPNALRFTGSAIPAGRNGHIQTLFITGTATSRDYDARAFTGIRLTLRATRPLALSLKIPDGHTATDVPYDHFSISLDVSSNWRTYVIPFTALRQSGIGTRQPALDLARLYALELQTLERDFDLSIDTIAFTR